MYRRWSLRALARVTLATTLLVVMFVACGNEDGSTGPGSSDERLDIVVSLPVFVSMVEEVGGDHVAVSSIVPAGVDPHTYQPSPGDAKKIADAELIVVNGAGLEEWLAGLIESAGGSSKPVIELSEGLALLDLGEPDGETGGPASPEVARTEEEHQHEQAAGNPHFWLDPEYASQYVERIVDALGRQDEPNAASYRVNGERFIDEIHEFDRWAKDEIAKIPETHRKIVTFHDAFPYFGAHFGLEVVGAVVISPGREPSPQELARLVDDIREQAVPAVFIEPQFNAKLADTIAREAGVETYTLYSDTATGQESYLQMMRANVENVVKGLS